LLAGKGEIALCVFAPPASCPGWALPPAAQKPEPEPEPGEPVLLLLVLVVSSIATMIVVICFAAATLNLTTSSGVAARFGPGCVDATKTPYCLCADGG
jgi:hypothetical protein